MRFLPNENFWLDRPPFLLIKDVCSKSVIVASRQQVTVRNVVLPHKDLRAAWWAWPSDGGEDEEDDSYDEDEDTGLSTQRAHSSAVGSCVGVIFFV